MRIAGPHGRGEQSLVLPWGSARASGQCWGLQSRCGAAPEPRAGVGQAAMPLHAEDSKGSHAALGKMPPWHQSEALHAPCLSFPTGEMVLVRSHWGALRHPARLSRHQPRTTGPAPARPVRWLPQGGLPCREGCCPESASTGGVTWQQHRRHSPVPKHRGGSQDAAAVAEQGCFPQLTGRHVHSSLTPGRMSPPCSPLSGNHPGGEAKLPHALF